MPELPEVETIRRSLLPHGVGSRITDVIVHERRLRRPIAPDFEARVRRRRITNIQRRGKYLLFDLEDGCSLLMHLGMTGSVEIKSAGAPRATHDRVRFRLDGERCMVFNDPRRFGLLRVGRTADLDELRRLGRDPLAAGWSLGDWRAVTRGRRVPIKNLLMDQQVIAGIGNIYSNEMLFEAGIRPRRRAGGIRRRELECLARAVRHVLGEAVRLGGSSIADFRDANGRPGSFQMRHTVYDREGEPCRRCHTPIRRIVLGGRSSFYCQRCQR